VKRTPLDAVHREAAARMVDFGGWEMPLHYGSQLEEHHAVRRDAGLFDVSHMRVVDVRGGEARAFLRRALANDVGRLATPGRALYSCMLADDGGVLDDLIVYLVRDDFFRAVVNAATAEKDVAWLESLRARWAMDVATEPRGDLAILALQGPRALERLAQALPAVGAVAGTLAPFSASHVADFMVARTGYTGEDGFEIVMPAAQAVSTWLSLVAAGARPCGLAARDTLRLEAGMNLYGQDMDAATSPYDAGLDWTVDLRGERDFVGREAILARGARRERVGLALLDAAGVLRAHQDVFAGEEHVGEVTSGTFSPTLGRSIALARVRRGIAPGSVVQVAVRGKRLAARVVKPAFVRHGKSLLPPEEAP
jgi:aminomethyltransferase